MASLATISMLVQMGNGDSSDRIARHSQFVDVCQYCRSVLRENALLKVKAVLGCKASEQVCYRVLGEELFVGCYV